MWAAGSSYNLVFTVGSYDTLTVSPSPATHAILTVLEAGESVFQSCY